MNIRTNILLPVLLGVVTASATGQNEATNAKGNAKPDAQSNSASDILTNVLKNVVGNIQRDTSRESQPDTAQDVQGRDEQASDVRSSDVQGSDVRGSDVQGRNAMGDARADGRREEASDQSDSRSDMGRDLRSDVGSDASKDGAQGADRTESGDASNLRHPQVIGMGCSSHDATPSLGAEKPAQAGDELVLQVRGMPRQGNVWYLFDSQLLQTPFDLGALGAPGCTLWVFSPLVPPFQSTPADGSGEHELRFPIPAGWRGVSLCTQAFQFTLDGSLSVTNALVVPIN